ncbi:MAG: flagellar basal body rod protein FlgB [Deltaproteobacteria bacterium]|nr:MAG: flagellar basal body rod protein FlgB [Deltaproteobacteria bacterium]
MVWQLQLITASANRIRGDHMGSEGIFSQTISFLERSLDLRSRKHDAIVSNVANIDTPNYKAFDVMVEDELQKLDRSTGAGKGVTMETTRAGHIEPHRNPIRLTTTRSDGGSDSYIERRDGNTVDLDREMAGMAENSLMYSLSAQIIARKFQSLRNVIEGGNK